MGEVVIVSAIRTAIGAFDEALSTIPAVELTALVIKAAIDRAGITADQVEAMTGDVLQSRLGQNPTRQAAIRAGMPAEVPARTLRGASAQNFVPLASIGSWACAGVDPRIMGTGPIPASRRAPFDPGSTIEDIDLVESNEAFASQTIAVARELHLDMDKTNVDGGAIALGHPVGASGARILVTLRHERQRRDVRRGLATLCIGGGRGTALVVER